MFYSHEVLTSRKYGVATVWLVATLGSKSSLKKINRKAILDVDVPKACRTIVDPGAPMALRLQGNLLYGVSRVYLQQCGYVLSDAQNAQNAMRMMLTTMKNAGLDPHAGKARPEHLVLQDDPSFVPGLELPPLGEFSDLNVGSFREVPYSGESQSLTPIGSQVDPDRGGPIGDLILPSSSSPGVGGFEIAGDAGPSSVGGRSSVFAGEEFTGVLEEPEFAFDADGNFIDLTAGNVVPATPAVAGRAMKPSDAGVSVRVRQEHEKQHPRGQQLGEPMDLDLPIYGDNLPEGEAFPTDTQQQPKEDEEVVESTSTVSAPMRRKKRSTRVLMADATMELRNKDLADWNTNYLQNMKVATRVKNQHRAAVQAKKNAEYFVWGAGIGGIGSRFNGATGPTPFDDFFGDKLFELFTGLNRKQVVGAKRDRDSGIDEATQEESRRVRHKSSDLEGQVGRGLEDEAMFMLGGDEVELPREAPSALDDHQAFSVMPWNVSASIRGSSAIPRSGRVGMVGSADPVRRFSHMISASPLVGRGRSGGLEALQGFEGEDEFGDIHSNDFGFPDLGPSSDGVEPQVLTEPSARVHEALSAEGENFLTFVTDAIAKKRTRIQAGLQSISNLPQAEAAGDIDEILFEELLSPVENSKMIACQALMIILALGTKGMLNVQQDQGFEEISLSLTDKAKAMQVAEVTHDEDEEERQHAGEGQFEEQFAANHGAGGGDDHDSLYDT